MPRKFKYGPPKEVVCPSCLESFPLWDMLFAEPGVTPVRAIPSFGDRVLSGLSKLHVAGISKPYPKYGISDKSQKLYGKYCLHCKGKLPWIAGQQTDVIIGLVGAKRSGKSHYVATLVDRLKKETGRSFEAALTQIDDETVDRYERMFYGPLYEDRMELKETPVDADPLLYNLSFRDRTGNNHNIKSVTLALYDTAGENFNTMDAILENTQYLRQASGLIFLIDPLQIQSVRQMVHKDIKLPNFDQVKTPEVILGGITNTIRHKRAIPANSQIDIPIAISLTKADALLDAGLVERGSRWAQNDCHKDHYDLSLHRDVDTMFSSLMNEWDRAAWNIVNVNFSDSAFFGVSSTGCSADESRHYKYISPHRVEDPLLWLLYELGVIDGGKFMSTTRSKK